MKKRIASSLLFAFAFLQAGESALPLGEEGSSLLAERRADAPVRTLKVYNWDDYILPDMDAQTAEENGYDPVPVEGINTRFEKHMRSLGIEVKVQYDTFSTNEDMINQLRTGKIDYDVIAPSDYAIQRMMAQDLLIPFDNPSQYPGSTPNYDRYASPFLIEKISQIAAKDVYRDGAAAQERTGVVQDYMRGYMWGTLGLVYNPAFWKFQDRGISPEKVDQDIASWSVLWDEDYENTAFVKDSVRDTMAAVVAQAFRGEIASLRERYEAGQLDEASYNGALTALFNRTDQASLDGPISQALRTLSENVYGYEVDNGKDDIQKGTMVGIDLAWSGDAVYAMNGADEAEGPRLYYALPQGADNIWFDGWVMTKNALDHDVTDLAQAYVDFLSTPNPESEDYSQGPTVANMDYIGYTPFLASDPILAYLRESYDLRADEGAYQNPPPGEEGKDYLSKDLAYFFEGTLESSSDAKLYYPVEEENRQLDAMYPDASILPRLVVMKDYGDRAGAVNQVWEAGKAFQFPLWGYWVTLSLLGAGLASYAFVQLRKKRIREERRERMANALLRQDASKASERQRKEAQKIVDKAQRQREREASLKEGKKPPANP